MLTLRLYSARHLYTFIAKGVYRMAFTSFSRSSTNRRYRTQAYRTQKELTDLMRQVEKMQEIQRAKFEVDMYENHLEVLRSIHKECEDEIDWLKLESTSAPFIKGEKGPLQLAAEYALKTYRPSVLDRLLKRTEKKKATLNKAILEAKHEDEQIYKAWEDTVSIAQKVNNGDLKAYLHVINEVKLYKEDPFSFGSFFEFMINEHSNNIVVQFTVNSKAIIPSKEKVLTKTGKLSIKEMSKTKFYAIYQDYVCSSVIRIARDLFAILPINEVIIHAMDNQVNDSTGYAEKQTILSVRMTRKVLNSLNLDKIDCSESITNFEHRMRFLKTSGFKPVEKILA